jgi:RNA polymerase sigma factor (sigma-70 family)
VVEFKKFPSHSPGLTGFEPHAENAKPTIFIVDDDDAMVDSLRVLVESVGHQACGYESAAEFLDDFDPARPGCIILDERMPGMSGHKLHEELLRRGSTIPIIMCTGHAEVQMAVDAMKRGAVTLVQKPFRDQDLLDAIEEALRRETASRQRRTRKRAIESRLETLTPRQREVMDLMVRGKPNKVIALELGISERTVELHRARVMRAMEVSSAAELAYLVARSDPDN